MNCLDIARRLSAAFRITLASAAAVLPALLLSQAVHAQDAPRFTQDQVAQGKQTYEQSCAICHGENMDDGEFGPPVKGITFRLDWAGVSLDELYDFMRQSMPPAAPGSLSNAQYAELLAFIFDANGMESGDQPLPTDTEQLASMVMPGKFDPSRHRTSGPSGGLAAGVVLPYWPTPKNPLETIRPVTDAMLANPDRGEWLTWRRTWQAQGYSPLDQINSENVKNLRVAWTMTLPPGPNEGTPLYHDGVLFVPSFGDNLQAFDARDGHELWRYTHELPEGAQPTVKKNVALYGDKIYMGTSDNHVVALDVKTGEVVWDQPIADPDSTFRLTGGPLAVRGKVMQGLVGRDPGGPYVVALDSETGKEAWRFYSIARPGEPGGNSWNGLPLEKRNGGSIWTSGSYDADLNLFYLGPAQTYDTGPLRYPLDQPGVTSDALYTDTTLAINPDTGKLVWHFQHMANDQWDFDWAFERQIFTMPVNGQQTKVVATAGKEGLYDILDARTGEYLFSFDMGLQNVITGIDPETGEKIIDPEKLPGDGKTKMVCPHAGAAKSWIPAAVNPDTATVFVPVVESCMDLVPVAKGERGSLSTGVRWRLRPRPDSDGRYGRVEAIDLKTRKAVWTQRQRAPQSSGALATAGGVVFAGALDRGFTAYDEKTGDILWKTVLNDVPNSAPITYELNGKQYLAVVVGYGGAQTATFPALVPEISLPAARSSTLWIFELP